MYSVVQSYTLFLILDCAYIRHLIDAPQSVSLFLERGKLTPTSKSICSRLLQMDVCYVCR